MTILSDAFDFLLNIGFLNIVVPFILFYAIVFGMLERTQIFNPDKSKRDERSTNLNSLIAFAIAITATAASNAVGITQNYLPILAVTAVVLLGVMMLMGMAFGDKFDDIVKNNVWYNRLVWLAAGILIIGALIVVVYYSGLLVTPCTSGSSLTPVNSLNTNSGQCTKLMDISGFPNVYILGLNMSDLLGSETLITGIAAIALLAGAFLAVKWLSGKNS